LLLPRNRLPLTEADKLLWSKATAARAQKRRLLPPETPHWAPCNRPPRLNRRKKESKKKLHAKAKANLTRELAVPKKARPKVELAAPAKGKLLKESAEKSPAAQVLKKNVLLQKATAREVRAAPVKAKVRAAQAKLLLKEIAKNNTEPYTAVRAHGSAFRLISKKTRFGAQSCQLDGRPRETEAFLFPIRAQTVPLPNPRCAHRSPTRQLPLVKGR